MNRRTSAYVCLLLTAALLSVLPGLVSNLTRRDSGRMAERLRPDPAQTLTVWIVSDATQGKTHLSEQTALFEKSHGGVRVYLRRADAAELFAQSAVLPDVVLFSPGAFSTPEKALMPIAHLGEAELPTDAAMAAGRSGGIQYAIPLWFAPSVLAVPSQMFPTEDIPTPRPTQTSLFNLGTPAPTQLPQQGGKDPSLPEEALIPWEALLTPQSLPKPEGIALIQLLHMCPTPMRPALVEALTGGAAQNPSDAPNGNVSRRGLFTPAPVAKGPVAAAPVSAAVLPLAQYRHAVEEGRALAAFAMAPACTQQVLFAGICHDHGLSQAFVTHLLGGEAQAALPPHGLLPTVPMEAQGDGLTRQLMESYGRSLLFPNAFQHNLQELNAICEDAFRRNQSPTETLLRLR